MTNTETGEFRWKSSLDQAKAEILGPEVLTAPAPLVKLANWQLVPIITEMERLLTDVAPKIEDTAFIHLKHVRHSYVDAAVEVMEDHLESTFFSASCNRFVERYERILKERGFTVPSPS